MILRISLRMVNFLQYLISFCSLLSLYFLISFVTVFASTPFSIGGDESEHETLSRNHPLADFIKENKGVLKGLSQEEFKAKYNEYMKGLEDKNGGKVSRPPSKRQESGDMYSEAIDESEMKDGATGNDFLDRIVLKFTTLSETNSEAPSFTIGKEGAQVGRDTANEVSVPSDTRLASRGHSTIEHFNGSFYLVDGGYDFSASIRISVGTKKNEWECNQTTRFSAGNSVFESQGLSEDGCLILEIIEGPLKGERRLIPKKGATLGRSSDNVISIPDRELSRRHSKVEYNHEVGQFCVSDTSAGIAYNLHVPNVLPVLAFPRSWMLTFTSCATLFDSCRVGRCLFHCIICCLLCCLHHMIINTSPR